MTPPAPLLQGDLSAVLWQQWWWSICAAFGEQLLFPLTVTAVDAARIESVTIQQHEKSAATQRHGWVIEEFWFGLSTSENIIYKTPVV